MFENDVPIDDSDYWDDTSVDTILEGDKEYSKWQGRDMPCGWVSFTQGGFEPPTRGFLFLSLKSKINS